MATQALVPLDEYLKTVYHPDCDYVDGIVEERNLGEKDHSRVQSNLVFLFRLKCRGTGLKVWPEWRFQTKPTRFRVPDVVITRGEPEGSILREAPLLCIEILSPEDRWSKMTVRLNEYFDYGVPEVWVVDPVERTLWICKSGSNTVASDPVRLTGTEIEVSLSEIFE